MAPAMEQPAKPTADDQGSTSPQPTPVPAPEEPTKNVGNQDITKTALPEDVLELQDEAPAPKEFPITVAVESVTLTDGYSPLLPDEHGVEAAIILTVTNGSDRTLRLGWFRPHYGIALTLGGGIKFNGRGDSVKGIPYCNGAGPGACAKPRFSVSLPPGERIITSVNVSTWIAASKYAGIKNPTPGIFEGQLAVLPGGKQEPYLQVISSKVTTRFE